LNPTRRAACGLNLCNDALTPGRVARSHYHMRARTGEDLSDALPYALTRPCDESHSAVKSEHLSSLQWMNRFC
jgi:hypothetical protein